MHSNSNDESIEIAGDSSHRIFGIADESSTILRQSQQTKLDCRWGYEPGTFAKPRSSFGLQDAVAGHALIVPGG